MHPIFLHLGFLTLPTFGVLAAIGLMLALSLSLRTAVIVGAKPDPLWNAGLFAIIAAFVLSRVLLVVTNLHTFFTYPIILLMVPSLTPLGLLLTALVTLIYLRVRAMPILASLDAWAPCGTFAWVFLALGHFAEGSDPGLPSNLPWAVAMPGTVRQHPVAIYAAIAAAVITVVLLVQLPRRHRDGDAVALAFALSGLAQFLLSFFREPALYPGTLGNLLDPVQWLALGMIVFAGILWQRPRRMAAYAV
ncbi:prolipoprotein diacylglyceryl transferase [Edaphobacter albus]|uniref:prolipoprotein diacylglyceryl transferase n=1 Tax=Edaphobacter sp. 4G125 TaxID=2763071 RepID=UPI001649104E|nr:prolipoprotein diacylglyceryl transferase family protein [Edaphobacter sp. 4G125]QNI37720.1 prolipoprotein diacylglyceryl transferase [Edaphobacter sp. 4G125]